MVARTPLQSLTRFDKLVNPDGTPTEFFMRLLQNSNILADDTQTQVETNTADIATIEAFTVNTSGQITGGPVSIGSAASVTIGHGPSGVAPGTYGDAANIPQITVDTEGHVTAASELALALAVDVEDEGVALGAFTALNFVGSGVVATDAGGGVANITVAGGGGTPWYVPEDALIYADFANEHYWRQDIGECSVTDIMPASGTFNPAVDIVPGVGLTTGSRTGETPFGVGEYIVAGAYALLSSGFSFRMDYDISVTPAQVGNDWVYTQVAWWDAGFNQELLANAYVGDSGVKKLRGEVYNFAPGSGFDVADTTISTGPYDAFAANFDPASGTVLMSRSGVTLNDAVYASTYAGLSQILIWAKYEPSGTGVFTGNATIGKLVFYPQKDQDGINALSERELLASSNLSDLTDPAAARTALDFVEAAQDVVGAMVTAAGGSYNDGTGAITLPGPALTTVEVDFGASARRSGSFTIAGVGMTVGKPVFIQKAAGPYTGKGTRADEAEMDPVTVTGIVESAAVIRCWWQSPSFIRGNIKFDYFIGA